MAQSRTARSFDVHPGVAMLQKWVAEMPMKTGRSLEQWADVARKLGGKSPERSKVVAAFKNDFGLGTNSAWHIFQYTFGQATWEGDDAKYLANAERYVAEQYSGTKAHFRPLFELMLAHVRKTFPKAKVCPCKTMVPFYRQRVFAEVRPATKTRFELCLALVDVPFEGVLEPNPRAKGNDRLRHRIALASEKDFTPVVKQLLKVAHDQDT